MYTDPRQYYEEPVLACAFNLWVDIHAPIEMVFRFLTEENGLNRWWTSHCSSEPRPGGRLHCVWEREKTITGDAFFRQFEPPNLLVVEWLATNGSPIDCGGGDPRGMRWPALNMYDLRLLDGNLTRLHVHDVGINAGDGYAAIREATGRGWQESLARLKSSVEAHARQKAMARQKRRDVAAEHGAVDHQQVIDPSPRPPVSTET